MIGVIGIPRGYLQFADERGGSASAGRLQIAEERLEKTDQKRRDRGDRPSPAVMFSLCDHQRRCITAAKKM
jgi:hypothetical protein